MNVSSSLNPSSSLSPQAANANPPQMVKQSQTSYQTTQSTISMKTAEGDVVTISGFTAAGSSIEQNQWRKAFEAGYSFSESTMQSTSLQMTVQGDLSEEELKDINSLLNDLQQISTTFFSGDSAQAMQAALAIGDMGSIQELEASFQYTAFASSQYVYHHPMPANLDEQLRQLQEELAALPSVQEAPLDQLLQAQWNQIEAFLDSQQAEIQTQPVQPAPDADTSLESFMAAMKERMDETIAKHPRLSPYTLPVARKALHNAQQAGRNGHGHGHEEHAESTLNGSILKELRNWLLSA